MQWMTREEVLIDGCQHLFDRLRYFRGVFAALPERGDSVPLNYVRWQIFSGRNVQPMLRLQRLLLLKLLPYTLLNY